jgi:hypothetical protein
MNFLDRLLGREPRDDSQQRGAPRPKSDYAGDTSTAEQLTDEQAIERYRYLLRTAPPEAIEQAHAEAFAQLTPEQRRQVLESLSMDLPPQERADRDDPQSLARMATRAELRQPGTLERTFGGMSPAGLMAGSFFSTIAGVVIGTAIADAIFNDGSYDQGYQDGAGAADADQGAEAADAGDTGGDTGFDAGGDVGGDFGGGDFGGFGDIGDFGGGEI